jgi:hypothetical protein
VPFIVSLIIRKSKVTLSVAFFVLVVLNLVIAAVFGLEYLWGYYADVALKVSTWVGRNPNNISIFAVILRATESYSPVLASIIATAVTILFCIATGLVSQIFYSEQFRFAFLLTSTMVAQPTVWSYSQVLLLPAITVLLMASGLSVFWRLCVLGVSVCW